MGPTSRRRQSRSVQVTPEADPRSAELGHNRKAGWDSALKRNFQHFSSVADEGVANESGGSGGQRGVWRAAGWGVGLWSPWEWKSKCVSGYLFIIFLKYSIHCRGFMIPNVSGNIKRRIPQSHRASIN